MMRGRLVCLYSFCMSSVLILGNNAKTAYLVSFQAQSFLRPFLLRRFRIVMPSLSAERARKPCLRLRRMSEGWKVRLMSHSPALSQSRHTSRSPPPLLLPILLLLLVLLLLLMLLLLPLLLLSTTRPRASSRGVGTGPWNPDHTGIDMPVREEHGSRENEARRAPHGQRATARRRHSRAMRANARLTACAPLADDAHCIAH